MEIPELTCGDCCMVCKFWKQRGSNDIFGWCKRFPPTRMSDGINGTLFPIVVESDWCGEFKRSGVIGYENE